jgi:hypothetical protein
MEEFRIDPNISYDVVELPSRGIFYKNKKKSLRVAYLTASDENILSAQNLIQNNTVVDELLKRKILDKDIDFDELVDEDRMSILVFLRNTAFGSDYSYKIVDPKTGKEFEVSFDLSELSFKEFNLESNENGEFKYTTTNTKIDITFTFLTKKQEKEIEQIEKSWNGLGVPPIITKQLEFMIKSVAGNKDPMNIRNFIENLPIKDSQDFRKYVRENRPSLDLKKQVTTPSGENIQVTIGFGVEFFRPFYGI